MGSQRTRRSRRTTDDQQLILPSEAPDVRELRISLARINWRIAEASTAHQWRQLSEVVMAVHLCGRNDGCRATVAALIAVANRNASLPLIRCESTWHRLWRKALAIGLVSGDPQRGADGGAPTERAVCRDRIVELVKRSGSNVRPPASDSHPTVTCQSPDSHHQRKKASETSESQQAKQTTSTPAEEVAAKIEQSLRRARIEPPRKLNSAVVRALAAGCTAAELLARVAWFADHVLDWPHQHRPGAIHDGLADARPGERVDWGWPHRKAVR